MVDGNIMATIIVNHMAVNIAQAITAPPPIGIHIVLMVQFPGIGIPPDIE